MSFKVTNKKLLKEIKESNIRPSGFSIPETSIKLDCRKAIDKKISKLISEYREIIAKTSEINFDCQFSDFGICKIHTEFFAKKEYIKKLNTINCCRGCRYTKGYFSTNYYIWYKPTLVVRSIVRASEIVYYRKRWNDYLGYWRPETGCQLERHMRSAICVFHNCADNGERVKIEVLAKEAAVVYEKIESLIKQKYGD